MKHGLLAGGVLLSMSLSAAAQELSLVVNSPSGASGTLCDPWSCTPATVNVPRGFPMQMVARGSFAPLQILLLAVPPVQCATIPGFGGSLILQPPGYATTVNVLWGHIYVSGAPGSNPCGGWMGFSTLAIPNTAPPGFQFVIQMLDQVPDPNLVPTWTFSNAVAVTVS